MTAPEALALLDTAIADDKPSRVNPTLTRAQAVQIMRDGVNSGIFEKAAAYPSLWANRAALIEKNIRRVAGDRR